MDPIQLFVPTFRVEECLAEIRQCLENGWTGMGFKTVQLEDAWKNYTGMPNAHFLASATAGLHLALKLFKIQDGWSDGDEVISSPLTFVSTNHAILYENLTPVFADIDDYLCLDPVSIEKAITPRTRAILFVGLGGNTGQLPEVVEIARKHKLRVILDAAHMAGTRLNGKHVGHESDAVTFSYQAVKNLPTADGGMICFRDSHLDAEVRKWTWLGINKDTFARTAAQGAYKWYYDVEHVGYKYHGNSVMAALGLVGLKYLDQDNAYRRQIAHWYDELLGEQSGLESTPMAPGCESSRHLYQVQLDRRDEVMAALNSMQIFPGVHYRDNSVYKMYRTAGECPRARQVSERLLSLPMHMRLKRKDIERVAQGLVSIIGHQSISRRAA